MSFVGFHKETFEFLIEIAFNNNVAWFNANRARFERFVRDPLRALASELMPTALDIDPEFNPNIATSVSRIRRDTRFTTDKSPFRSNMWIAYRYPHTRLSESCTLFFEITPNDYSYGFGFYSTGAEFMAAYRKRLLTDPAGFLSLAHRLEKRGYVYEAEVYKRDRFPDAPKELKPYIGVKSFAWIKRAHGVSELIEPSDIAEKLKADFLAAKPMYSLLRSIAGSMPHTDVDERTRNK